jgi:ATP-dependent Clp protease ATP-binding subunit ClpA
MFERFTKDARAAVHTAVSGAKATGQPTVEAEHLLLALATRPELQSLGLDREQLVEALIEEERQSLAAVGLSAANYQQPRSDSRAWEPRFGASAKLALQRGVKLAQLRGGRRFTSQDLLGGVLAAEHGRVPRALDLAGINVDDLRDRIRH